MNPKAAQQGEGITSQPVRNTPPRPPQGAPQSGGPQPGQANQPAGDPGVTGVYQQPNAQARQDPGDEGGSEGVRIIRS